jgi:rfaE bifunctional protein nucleotidyltransferase chain/domain
MDKFKIITSKIIKKEEFDRSLNFLKFKDKKIVFTNGCFDILHRGHFEYLNKAANFGDILIIGLNSDSSVKRIKGENRPLNDEYSRALGLASLQYVSYIILFDEDTPYQLIKYIQPDVLIKGADYRPDQIVGADIVVGKGGQIATVELSEGFSTTSLIAKLKAIHD